MIDVIGQCRKGCCPCREICSDETACPVLQFLLEIGIHQIQYPRKTGPFMLCLQRKDWHVAEGDGDCDDEVRERVVCAAQAGSNW